MESLSWDFTTDGLRSDVRDADGHVDFKHVLKETFVYKPRSQSQEDENRLHPGRKDGTQTYLRFGIGLPREDFHDSDQEEKTMEEG